MSTIFYPVRFIVQLALSLFLIFLILLSAFKDKTNFSKKEFFMKIVLFVLSIILCIGEFIMGFTIKNVMNQSGAINIMVGISYIFVSICYYNSIQAMRYKKTFEEYCKLKDCFLTLCMNKKMESYVFKEKLKYLLDTDISVLFEYDLVKNTKRLKQAIEKLKQDIEFLKLDESEIIEVENCYSE